MNVLHFEDIYLGMSAFFSVNVTSIMLKTFSKLSGDFNPLHVDLEYAQKKGHPGLVVHGLLTSSLYSRLVGMNIPGKFALLQSIEVKFTAPVYIGDLLKVEGSIINIHESVQQIEIEAHITNQAKRQISKASIKVGLYA